jgi:hypothetical protein
MNFFSSIISAISNIFGWALNRSTLKNSADVKAAEKAQREVNTVDRTNKAILNRDTNEIRKELSE